MQKRHCHISPKAALTLTASVCIGAVVYTGVTGAIPLLPMCRLAVYGFTGLLVSLFLNKERRLWGTYTVFAVTGVTLAGWGLLQYLGWLPSTHRLFAVTGPFDNPTGIGMCLAILFPYVLYHLPAEHRNRQRMRQACACLLLLTIVLSGSRTAIAATGAAFLVLYAYRIRRKHLRWILILILLACMALYLYKPVSANGRLFMWWIGGRLASGHWWSGNGWNGFDHGYMLEQAAYFLQHPHSMWAQVADDVRSPFNEYLLFFIRFGLVGVLWLAVTTLCLYRRIRPNYCTLKLPAVASLCALSVCGCFSYPSYYISIVLIGVTGIGILCSSTSQQPSTRPAPVIYTGVISLALVIALFGCGYCYHTYERPRLQLEQRSADGERSRELDQAYEALHHTGYFKSHAVFLYNYALHLYEQGYYPKALTVLHSYRSLRNDYDGQMLYAYTLARLSRRPDAIGAFKLASAMLPGRLQPRYELMRLYDQAGNQNQARREAQAALQLPLKVSNQKTDYLRHEMADYLSGLQASQP